MNDYGVAASSGRVSDAVFSEHSDTLDNSQPPFAALDDTDIDACQSMYLAVLNRTISDACGVTCDKSKPRQIIAVAMHAWAWLHSMAPEAASERWTVCEFAGLEGDEFDRRVSVAMIPRPTAATLANVTEILATAFWRMGGMNGPAPTAKPHGGFAVPRRYPTRIMPRPTRAMQLFRAAA